MVDAYLMEEILCDRVAPLLPQEDSSLVHTSPFGVIPKKRKLGKWTLAVDLSAPQGRSVNDGIDKAFCSLAYLSLDAVVDKQFSS